MEIFVPCPYCHADAETDGWILRGKEYLAICYGCMKVIATPKESYEERALQNVIDTQGWDKVSIALVKRVGDSQEPTLYLVPSYVQDLYGIDRDTSFLTIRNELAEYGVTARIKGDWYVYFPEETGK